MSNRGVTLIELAIALVVIGLLIGGVLSGQELVKQSLIYKDVATIRSYNTSIETFRAKFNAIPGDYKDAILAWPDCEESLPDLYSCSGNGNGVLDRIDDYADETNYVWYHLTLANLSPTQFDSPIHHAADYDNDNHEFYKHMMPITRSNHSIQYDSTIGYEGLIFDLEKKKSTLFGFYGRIGGDGIEVVDPFIVYSFDRKLDEGTASGGNMRVNIEEGNDCADETTGQYINFGTEGICQFVIGY